MKDYPESEIFEAYVSNAATVGFTHFDTDIEVLKSEDGEDS